MVVVISGSASKAGLIFNRFIGLSDSDESDSAARNSRSLGLRELDGHCFDPPAVIYPRPVEGEFLSLFPQLC